MSGILLCNIIGWTSLITSWIIPKFKFKDEKDKYVWGIIFAGFSVGIFTATFILQ